MSADPTYAAHLMSHARQLFEFADKCRGIGSVAYYPYVPHASNTRTAYPDPLRDRDDVIYPRHSNPIKAYYYCAASPYACFRHVRQCYMAGCLSVSLTLHLALHV